MHARLLAAAVVVFVALMAAACTDGDGGDDDAVEPQILEFTPQPTTLEGEPTPTPVPEGRDINQYELDPSMCFNRYALFSEQLNESFELTTEVDCRRPHDGEVYATYVHPAGPDTPFPGKSEMERWANIQCHAGFEAFVGRTYEESELYIGTIRPTEETWVAGPHREVICYVFAPEAQLQGPMGGTRL